jgi:hypothetical protein
MRVGRGRLRGSAVGRGSGGGRRSAVAEGDWVSLNDAVEYFRKTTGRTRRQAERAVLEALRSGKVEARGHRVAGVGGQEADMGVQTIAPEVFRNARLPPAKKRGGG